MTEAKRQAPWASRLAIRLMERIRRTDGLGLLPALEASQWHDPDVLLRAQTAALKEHLIFCGREVPYYRDLFAELGFDPAAFTDPAQLAALPVLEKDAIIDAGDRMHSSVFASSQPRRKNTSGSTGRPLNYYLDMRSHSYLWAHIWRAWSQLGYRPGDYFATLSGGSLLPEKVDFKQRVYLLLSRCLHLPSYHLTPEIMRRYIEVLRGRGILYVYGYPSSLGLFSRFLLDEGVVLEGTRAVITTSEMLTPSVRADIEAAFACRVLDSYGCNDGGLYGFECEHRTGFHQNMESCLVEAVDDEGRPLPDGETGRIVTTHFANRSHPFLRYATGDVGAVDRTTCACGRGLLRIVNLQGRERDFVYTPAGRKVHGAFFNHFEPFYDSEWLERFQVYQPERGRLIVRIQVRRAPTPEEEARIVAELRKGLGDMEITLEQVTEFRLTRTGKFRVVESDVES